MWMLRLLTCWPHCPFAWPARVSLYVWLQVVGLYRLCGSAAVKKELREAFERDSHAVELNESVYPDINVITGKNLTCSRKHRARCSPQFKHTEKLLLLKKYCLGGFREVVAGCSTYSSHQHSSSFPPEKYEKQQTITLHFIILLSSLKTNYQWNTLKSFFMTVLRMKCLIFFSQSITSSLRTSYMLHNYP